MCTVFISGCGAFNCFDIGSLPDIVTVNAAAVAAAAVLD